MWSSHGRSYTGMFLTQHVGKGVFLPLSCGQPIGRQRPISCHGTRAGYRCQLNRVANQFRYVRCVAQPTTSTAQVSGNTCRPNRPRVRPVKRKEMYPMTALNNSFVIGSSLLRCEDFICDALPGKESLLRRLSGSFERFKHMPFIWSITWRTRVVSSCRKKSNKNHSSAQARAVKARAGVASQP